MSSHFEFQGTPLDGLFEFKRKHLDDDRGFFGRLFCSDEFNKVGLKARFVQVNHSKTKNKGTIRGMHFQYPPYTESKIITCIKGEVFDVAVDIRQNSKTFLQWYSVLLSENNLKGIYIPDGFAHGFQTLNDDCQLLYMHSNVYEKSSEGAINPMDSKLGIKWPYKVSEISRRDANHPMLNSKFKGILIP